MKPRILAIIPARGGSKGISKKNIRPLLGKPLIAWTIGQAINSRLIDKLIVNTDDEEIASISKDYGADVPFMRPKDQAADDTPMIDVMSYTLDWFEERSDSFDIIALLEPTSPLRKDDDIDTALDIFIKNMDKAESLVSLGEIRLENPYLSKTIDDEYVKPIIKNKKNISRRQELPKTYFPYGVIYSSKITTLSKYQTFYQAKTIPYLIERWQNYEIDDIYDFICVEAIMKKKLEEGMM